MSKNSSQKHLIFSQKTNISSIVISLFADFFVSFVKYWGIVRNSPTLTGAWAAKFLTLSSLMIGISTVLLWGLWLGSIAGVVSWMIALMRDRRSSKRQKPVAQTVVTYSASHPVGIRTPPPVPPNAHDGLEN